MVGPGRRSNISFRVTKALGQSIVLGEYGPDRSLPAESALCERFGTSRTVVREAVKMLAAKGMISSKPRQGIRVLAEEHWNIFDPDLLEWSLKGKLSDDVLREFFQLRIAVEPEAAALAARLASQARIEALGATLERMQAEPPDSPAALAADIEFHIQILYATGNRFYIRLRDFIRTALDASIRVTTGASADYPETLALHREVLDAIRAGDEGVARDRMRYLIEHARNRFETSPTGTATTELKGEP